MEGDEEDDMKSTEIETLPAKQNAPRGVQKIRLQAPKLLASVINQTRSLRNISSIVDLRPEHVQAIGGGVDAATYFINHPDEKVVIKLSYDGLEAEAEAINAWRARHVRGPNVIAVGTVPVTKSDKQPVKYLAQQAMLGPNGRLIETCAAYLTREPKNARRVGKALGHELDKLHSCVSNRTFGDFKDAGLKKAPYKDWNGYVIDIFKKEAGYLQLLGLKESDIKHMIAVVSRHRFVRRGRYLHGDFSIRNVAVKSYDPLRLSIFDPNPLVGDPSWDVAILANNREFHARRLAYDDSQADIYRMYQQLWTGFMQGYRRKVNERSLLTAQFVQAIYQAQYTQSKSANLDFRVRKEFIHDTCQRLLR